MSDSLRASDLDREARVSYLREAAVEGRLTMEEFSERVEAVNRSRTVGELDQLTRDLPIPTSPRRPTRWLLAALGSVKRAGRLTVGRWVVCLVVLGSVDLDLRQATLTGGSVTIVVVGVIGSVDVYIPEGLNAEVRALSVLGHADANGNELAQPGSPLVRLVSLSALMGIDIWRVPTSWGQRSWRQLIKAIRRGEHLLPPGT
ncbi:MAG: DUF1707 SHOCT-like domain-containing protein [Candidatus Dormibacteria bacterium]